MASDVKERLVIFQPLYVITELHTSLIFIKVLDWLVEI